MLNQLLWYAAQTELTSIPWAVRFGWLENAYARCLCTAIFSAGDQGSFSRSVHTRLRVCVQWLWLVPAWLTSRHTHKQDLNSLQPAALNSEQMMCVLNYYLSKAS